MDAELSNYRRATRGSPPSAAGRFFGECGGDRMVKVEWEAAEALAGLAHSAMRERGGDITAGESSWKGGNSVSQRVKNESPAGDSGINPEGSLPRSSDSAEDQAVMVLQQHEKICNMMIKPVKREDNDELPKASPMCTTTYASCGGGKSRQNLTEAEKEARRLRRVLANRESARQTIRRRQALYEELTRKAADLAWENENLKREMELAVKEYDSLKSTNECLRAQMAKTVKAEVEETQEETKTTHSETSTTPSRYCPIYTYNQPPFMPFLWPSIIQCSNPVQLQCRPHNGIDLPSKVPMQDIGKPASSFHEQENSVGISRQGTPFYMLPRPWVFPLPNHNNELHPQSSFDLNDKQNETCINNQCSASSSSRTIAHVENHGSSVPIKVETAEFISTEAIPANIHETPFCFPPDKDGQHLGHFPKGRVLMPVPLNSVRPTENVEHENNSQPGWSAKAISSTVGRIVSALPEKDQEPVICPSTKLVDAVAVAAAEARKKRKELTKLKNLHCRQF